MPTATPAATLALISLPFSFSGLVPAVSKAGSFGKLSKLPLASGAAFCIKISSLRGVLGLSGLRPQTHQSTASLSAFPLLMTFRKHLNNVAVCRETMTKKVWCFASGLLAAEPEQPALALTAIM